MDSANKISTSVAFGISSSIISCIGCYSCETLLVDEDRYIYGYRPETVFMCSSAVVGMIVALIVFHTFTFVECYKLSKANPKLGNTFKLFVKKVCHMKTYCQS